MPAMLSSLGNVPKLSKCEDSFDPAHQPNLYQPPRRLKEPSLQECCLPYKLGAGVSSRLHPWPK